MTNTVSVKTNFTAGEISSNLFGRGDLSVYENGARCLENIIIHPTGGISRRKGLKMIAKVGGEAKLISFEFNSEQVYLLCLLDKKMQIYKNDICVATMDTPWGVQHHAQLNWTQSADTLLIVHPDVEPQQITRNIDEIWKIEPWEYYVDNKMICCPYFNFHPKRPELNIIINGNIATITSMSNIFSKDYIGVKIKTKDGLLEVLGFNNEKEVIANVIKPVKTGIYSDWEEQSFSKLRGWPTSVTFHQDRLVIGGSKSLPNRLWMSKSSDLFNFDLGTGLDDEAIEFAILSDQVNKICHVISARHLLVFTTGSEWMVSGDVLTPTSIQLSRQTDIGSYNKYSVAPQQINGATVFVSSSGKQLREFLFADTEQAYLSKDLSMLADDKLLINPVCSAFDKDDSVLYLLLDDGTVSCLTSYRTEDVNAWSHLKTNGNIKSLTIIGEDMYFVVFRKNEYFIEKFDKDLFVDCGLVLLSDKPKKHWSDLDIMENMEVSVVSGGFYLGKYLVKNGSIELFEEVSEIIVGIAYEHKVDPLPYMVDAMKPFSPKATRVIDAVFRIINTKSLRVDMGKGCLDVPLKRIFKDKILDAPAIVYSGDIELHSIKWIRDLEQNIWSIKSDIPLPFTLLSVVMKLKIKN